MSFLYSLVGFVIAIGVLVAVHEFGHFWVAKKLGVKVLKFSIGMGKPLWSKVYGKDQTEFVIAAIPLGGYVKMLGENDPDAPINPAESHRAFDNQPIWKRALIVIAGPAINFLFAILLFFLLAIPSEEALKPELGPITPTSVIGSAGIKEGDNLVSIDGRAVNYHREHDLYIFNQVLRGKNIDIVTSTVNEFGESIPRSSELDVSGIPIYNINPSFIVRDLGLTAPMPEISTKLQRVLLNSRAAAAGLLVGDIITEVDGLAVASWRDLVAKILNSPEKPMLVTLIRGDSTLRISVTPEVKEDGAVQLGVAPTVLPWSEEQKVTIQRSLPQALLRGVEQTWLMSVVTLRMLWKMVTLQVSHKNISGPITIADVAGQAIQVGFDSYLYILAVISISLGVMNLLPIPMLDGGHLLMYAVEIVGGKNLSEQVFAVGQRLGIVMLIGLMSLAFYNDIFRLLN